MALTFWSRKALKPQNQCRSHHTTKTEGPEHPNLLSPSTPTLLPDNRHSPNTPPWPTPFPKRPLSRPLLHGLRVSGWGRLAQLCREPCRHKRLGWQPLTLHNVPLTGHRATRWVTSLQQAAPGEAECPPPHQIPQTPPSIPPSSLRPGKRRDRRGQVEGRGASVELGEATRSAPHRRLCQGHDYVATPLLVPPIWMMLAVWVRVSASCLDGDCRPQSIIVSLYDDVLPLLTP